MGKIGIIVIGYNRPHSIQRVLAQLDRCEYESDEVDLIISLDNCGNDACECVSNRFDWHYGRKEVISHKSRMGLRNHVLACGDIVLDKDYDAVIIFEDDVFPAPGFYSYTKKVYEFYKNEHDIAGISLYSPTFMTSTDVNFTPQTNFSDVYFMKIAQSWGQVWSKRQWREFREWYKINSSEWEKCDNIPSEITQWGKNSWLKYHMKYCAEKNKYFVFPYNSFVTCFSEAGQHTTETSALLQRPFIIKGITELRLIEFSEDCVKYDSFYENENIINYIACEFGVSENEITIDIYNTKPTHKRYWVTTQKTPFEVIASYDMVMKPHEMNILYNIKGEKIFVYDTDILPDTPIRNTASMLLLEKMEYYNDFKLKRRTATSIFIHAYKRSIKHWIMNKRNKNT